MLRITAKGILIGVNKILSSTLNLHSVLKKHFQGSLILSSFVILIREKVEKTNFSALPTELTRDSVPCAGLEPATSHLSDEVSPFYASYLYLS